MDYIFTLTGRFPLLFHADDVMAADKVKEWQKDPKNKNISIPGDDRSPPWTWQTYLYLDSSKEKLVIPTENVMACLRGAGSRINLPKGKGTFKAVSQSGIIMSDPHCEFMAKVKDKYANIQYGPIAAMADEPFKKQFDSVEKMGFKLLVKRARVDKKKHVRVRAMFENWIVKGRLEVIDNVITPEVLGQLFELGGRYVGLCDWRPGSPSAPGSYGMFRAKVETA